MVSKRNGNVSIVWQKHNTDYEGGNACSVPIYLFSLWPVDRHSSHCLGVKDFNFLLSSRPWQCEIQVDFFMPDEFFHIGQSTEIFDSLSASRLKVLPSPIHILVDIKSSVHEYDWVSLAVWTSRRKTKNTPYINDVNDIGTIFNHVQIIAHVGCKTDIGKIQTNVGCRIKKINAIYLCPECRTFVNVYPLSLGYLSFTYITDLEKRQKYIAFPDGIRPGHATQFQLAGQIAYYAEKEFEKLQLPLQNL